MSAWVNSKVQLARELGLSRQWITELFRLPDHPPARPNGQHSVSQWRKFVVARAEKIHGHGTELERLKIDLLRNRVAGEQLELAEMDHTIREQIADEICMEASIVLQQLRYKLDALPNELAPRLSDKTPVEIFKMLREALNMRLSAAADALEKIAIESRRKLPRTEKKEIYNVIRFDRARAATGGTQ